MYLLTPADRLKWARIQHAVYSTPTDAAKAFGWPISTYLGHENGDRNPSRNAAKRYGRAYRVRWEWLLEGEGDATLKIPPVKLIGTVGNASIVVLYDQPLCLEPSDIPIGAGNKTRALIVTEASMRGIADDGWLVFFEDDQKPPSKELFGKLCVIQLKGGEIVVRTLQPGRQRNRFDLESASASTLRDQQVAWAARVTWIKPR